jgi:arylsulfatase A-like enzyme
VIVLSIDTLRRDGLGAFGGKEYLSPCLDRLTEEGFAFRCAIAPSSWTKPSVASLMTGMYPGQHGAVLAPNRRTVVGFKGTSELSSKYTTLAERLKAEGYRTAAFITNPFISRSANFHQGFDDFTQPAGNAEELLDRAAAWIDSLRPDDRFFLFLHLIDPHDPYFPPGEYLDQNQGIDPGPGAPFSMKGDPGEIKLWLTQYKRWESSRSSDPFEFDYQRINSIIKSRFPDFAKNLETEQIREHLNLDFEDPKDPDLQRRIDYLTSLYEAEIMYCDEAIGNYIQGLRNKGILDETLLVVSADHGEALFEHMNWGHCLSVHGEEVNIPLLFRIPGPGGPLEGSHDGPVSLVDVFPTILDLLDLTIPEKVTGCSLKPLIVNGDAPTLRKRPVFSETSLQSRDCIAVQITDKKMIRTMGRNRAIEWAFYDLESDPLEMDPLDPEEAGAEARTMMHAIDRFAGNRRRDYDDTDEMKPFSEEEKKQIKALGYL